MTVAQYLKQLQHPQKGDILRLHKFMRKEFPQHRAALWGPSEEILGYGSYDYVYDSGRKGSWFLFGFAARKGYVSVYCMASCKDGYLTDEFSKKLGPVKTGKCCINIKDFSKVDENQLQSLMRQGVAGIKEDAKSKGWSFR